MTLSDFSEMCFSCPDSPLSAVIYVFDDEDDADNWLNGKYEDAIIALVICSNYKTDYWLRDKFAKARVQHFFAVDKDKIAVVIDTRQEKKDDVD